MIFVTVKSLQTLIMYKKYILLNFRGNGSKIQGMKQDKHYEDLREEAILAYQKTYKESLAFDMVKATKEERARLLTDPIFIAETRAIKASFFVESITELGKVIKGDYADENKGLTSSEVMKALDMRNKMIFSDLDEGVDESSALNIVVLKMTREEMEAMDTVEIFHGAEPELADNIIAPGNEIPEEENEDGVIEGIIDEEEEQW